MSIESKSSTSPVNGSFSAKPGASLPAPDVFLLVLDTLKVEGSWQSKVMKTVTLISPFIPFTVAIFSLHPYGDEEYCFSVHRPENGGYRIYNYQEFLAHLDLTETTYYQIRAADEPALKATGIEFDHQCGLKPMLKKVAQSFGVKSWIYTPLDMGMPGRFRISFMSESPSIYTNDHLTFLVHLGHYMEIGLSRILAFEQLQRLSSTDSARVAVQKKLESIVVSHRGKKIIIPIIQLRYVKSAGNYCSLHSLTSTYLHHQSLSDLASVLDRTPVIRIHRGHLVNMKYIKQYNAKQVFLDDGTVLPIGRTYRESFLRHLPGNN